MQMDKKVIVSLTSYPKRIESVKRTVEVLLEQSFKRENYKILLHLWKDEFDDRQSIEKEFAFAPKENFAIVWVDENLRSHLKIHYALKEYPECPIITVDDDVIYSPTMIQELWDGHLRFPKCIISRRVHLMTRSNEEVDKYAEWYMECAEFENVPRLDLVATGVGAVLYPAGIFDDEVLNKSVFMKECPYADDLWLKIMELRQGIPTVFVRGWDRDRSEEKFAKWGLFWAHNSDGGNDAQLKRIIKRYDCEIQQYFSVANLIETEDIVDMKQKYGLRQMEQLTVWLHKNGGGFIYGAGFFGKLLFAVMEEQGKSDLVKGFLVNNVQENPSYIDEKRVLNYRAVEDKQEAVVIALSADKQNEVIEDLLLDGYAPDKILWINRQLLKWLRDNKESLGIDELKR